MQLHVAFLAFKRGVCGGKRHTGEYNPVITCRATMNIPLPTKYKPSKDALLFPNRVIRDISRSKLPRAFDVTHMFASREDALIGYSATGFW